MNFSLKNFRFAQNDENFLHKYYLPIVLYVVKSALGRVYICNAHSSSRNISGFDVTMWLQHLALVPHGCVVIGHEATLVGALLADSVHGFVAVILYFK